MKGYKVTHYDPCRWFNESCAYTFSTLREARAKLRELLVQYPLGHQGYAKIEKVELIDEVRSQHLPKED
jgi:hypothetical protein